MRRRLVGRVRSIRVAAADRIDHAVGIAARRQILHRLGDQLAVGREVLQRANARIEGDHGRLALFADQQRRDQAADLLDLRQDALHVRVGLQQITSEIGW